MTAALAAAPSQQHPRSSKPAPLWGFPLHGTPCGVCGLPAVGVNIYPDGRFVYHRGAPPCALPNPPRATPGYQDAT